MTQQQRKQKLHVLLSDDVERAVGQDGENVSLVLQSEGRHITAVELTPLAAEVLAQDLERIAAIARRYDPWKGAKG